MKKLGGQELDTGKSHNEENSNELKEQIYKDEYINVTKIKDTVTFIVNGLSFKGDGADIGMGVISTALDSVVAAIENLVETGRIVANVTPLKYIFIVYDLSITFTYNTARNGLYKGIGTTAFNLLVVVVTLSISFKSLIITIIVAAIIALVANLLSNTEWFDKGVDKLIDLIIENVEKAKNFINKNKDKYHSFFNIEFLKNLCEDLTCKDFSETTFQDLLAYSGYDKTNGNAWMAFIYSRFNDSI